MEMPGIEFFIFTTSKNKQMFLIMLMFTFIKMQA